MAFFKKRKKANAPKYGWFGDYKNWNDNDLLAGGYNSSNILLKTKESLLKIKNGEAIYERDSVLFDKKEYPYSVISSLLYAAINSNNILNVIDFGGSLGSTWYQVRDFIPSSIQVTWTVVEQKDYVDCGRNFFQDEILKFDYTINESMEKAKANVLLLSGVIQYLENPYEFLSSLRIHNFDYIIIDRTAFLKENRLDRLTLQIVTPEIYEAQYPSWFFNEKFFLEYFHDYTIKSEFESYVVGEQNLLIDGIPAGYDKGFFLEKKTT